MKSHRIRLQVEELGSRLLPSTVNLLSFVPPGAVPVAHVAAATHRQQDHALAGQGQGAYVSSIDVPDTGTKYDLEGTASLAKLGDVTVAGSIKSVGFIRQGHAHGTLTFSNAQGSVTVELTGPVQDGFAPLPDKFHYKVVSGTGAYQNVHDHGTLHLTLTPAADGASAGTFTLRIR